MSSSQSQLGAYSGGSSNSVTHQAENECGRLQGILNDESERIQPQLGFESTPTYPPLSEESEQAREAEWVIFTGRYPFVFDAARFGFAIGHREDSSYQWSPDEVSLPVHFLDNNYENADLSRFVDRVFEYEPEIAVLGDIYEPDSLDNHLSFANEIWGSFPDTELIIVPKTKEILEDIPDTFILGFPNGASDIQGRDVAQITTWRRLPHRLHILGGTPISTFEVIQRLTETKLGEHPKANIAGVDWNGFTRYAQEFGDYASSDGGWCRNLREEYAPQRALVIYSLLNAKHFWVSRGVWPDHEQVELPNREQMLKTIRTSHTTQSLPSQKDTRELALSPILQPLSEKNKVIRTDDTQVEVMEPLDPLSWAVSNEAGELSWQPDGKLENEMTFKSPFEAYIEPICYGCGQHLTLSQSENQPTGDSTLIWYLLTDDEESHHYQSVAADQVDFSDGELIFNGDVQVAAFCSDHCRKRAEYYDAHQLTPESTDCWPNTITST